MSQKIKKLTDFFSKLPGVGPRQALKMVLALIDWPEIDLTGFSQALVNFKQGPLFCKNCFNITDNDLCYICSNTRRNQTQIAVVEKITDLEAMEKGGNYRGVYHILGGAINPVEGVLPEKLKIAELKNRIEKLKNLTSDIELILATNPTTAGETTALYLTEKFKSFKIKTTRLARGLSSGTFLEYADESTLAQALKHRR